MNTLQRLHAEQDQSPWIDFIDRELIDSGKLARAGRDGDPWPHQQPDHLWQGGRQRPVRRPDPARDRRRRTTARESTRRSPSPTVSDAADVLRVGLRRGGRSRWLRLDRGRAGPGRRHRRHAGARATPVERVWRARTCSSRSPPRLPGLPAIEDAIAEGININITLMFSVDVYRDVRGPTSPGCARGGSGART